MVFVLNKFVQNNVVLTIIYLTVLIRCTSNPIGDDEIRLGNRQISGSIQLGNGLPSEGIFVWLEGFNDQTLTDDNGQFKLTLPPKTAQANSNGVTGAFNLYFYMANFKLETMPMQVSRGEFIYPPGVFNDEGELNRPAMMTQILNVKSQMSPTTFATDHQGLLTARIFLQTTEPDTVFTLFPPQVGTLIYPLLIQNIETGAVDIIETTHVGIPFNANTDTLKITRDTPVEVVRILRWNASDFQPGSYRIIPYIQVLQEGIPPQLLDSIGSGIGELGPKYLDLPFYREGGEFSVNPAFNN